MIVTLSGSGGMSRLENMQRLNHPEAEVRVALNPWPSAYFRTSIPYAYEFPVNWTCVHPCLSFDRNAYNHHLRIQW